MNRKKIISLASLFLCVIWMFDISKYTFATDNILKDHNGKYRLVKGQEHPICQDFLKNLEIYSEEQPMVCDRIYHPSLKLFRSINWKEVNPYDYEVLFKQMFLMYHSPSEEILEQKKDLYESRWNEYVVGGQDTLTLDERLEKGVLKIWRGFFDIVHEGQKQIVLKVAFRQGCDVAQADYLAMRRVPNYAYYVLDSRGELDLTYWPLARSLEAGDIVFYEDKIRRVQWNNGLQQSATPRWPHGGIIINDPRASRREHIKPHAPQQIYWRGTEVCGFEYMPSEDKKEINQ